MGTGFESTIDIYLRVRPIPSGTTALFEVKQDEGLVTWTIPRHVPLGMVNHQREHYTFKFNGIFDVDVKQDEVFQKVAHKVVVGSLDGYNGTIFAYGQTSSGKTYTITGRTERYVDRGIIPRAISLIFNEIAGRSDYTYTLHFSYMEVYNEMGYDLLNPDHETSALEDLPKVTLLEDEDSVFHLRNLSQHLATYVGAHYQPSFGRQPPLCMSVLYTSGNNQHLLSHLTPKAQAHILGCKVGKETVRKSKLNLVDLAGSERVWKTGVNGQILREAKYINLSLHHLEQVIVALQEKSQGKMRSHIPYRNSMMTSVLRDSVGGNCRTVMIATVTIARDQLPETISTCRFAQRVAMISNQVTINEDVDSNLLIKRLKEQICELKEEITLLRGVNENCPPLSATEIENVRTRVIGFASDTSSNADLHCGGSITHVRAAFQIFKELLNRGELRTIQAEPYAEGDKGPSACVDSTNLNFMKDRSSDLQYQLQQRDNEIQILVAFIRKREAAAWGTTSPLPVRLRDRPSSAHFISGAKERRREKSSCQQFAEKNVLSHNSQCQELKEPNSMELRTTELLAEIAPEYGLIEKDKAFGLFMKRNLNIEENKSLLKITYANAKALGEKINRSKDKINALKERIEKHRVERAQDYLVSGVSDGSLFEHDQEEGDLLCSMNYEKQAYKEGFGQLRDQKKEIEHLHKLIGQSQAHLQGKFEMYWSSMRSAPAQTETSTKAPSIPRLRLQSSPKEEMNSLLWDDNSSLNAQITLHSPLWRVSQGVESQQIQALCAVVCPTSKDCSALSNENCTSGHFGIYFFA